MKVYKSDFTYAINCYNQIAATIPTYLIIFLVLLIFALLVIVIPMAFPVVLKQMLRLKGFLIEYIRRNRESVFISNESLDEAIEIAGYSYDAEQDIYYSNDNPWQKKFGYCRLYDEASAPLGMIIDCEPVQFEYNKKKWLIEFWKGQYDLNSGGEIGIYNTKDLELSIPNIFEGFFYQAADEDEELPISFTLYKNGKKLFSRSDRHWWLTGFKMGEFSDPSELTMFVQITFIDKAMRNAFLDALVRMDYNLGDLEIHGDTVGFIYDKPHSSQPLTRTDLTDWIIQRKNEYLCKEYRELVEPYADRYEQAKAVKEQSPEIYATMLDMGRKKHSFDGYYTLMPYFEE